MFQIEVITLSDDDNKPAKLHPNLPEEIASNPDSMKVGPDEDDIMILQEKGRDERSIVDSESDMAIDAKPGNFIQLKLDFISEKFFIYI